MVAGRNFSRDFRIDTSAFLINEAAVRALGLKSNEDAIGKDFGYGSRKGKMIGVINDFHFESMHQKIVPLVFISAHEMQIIMEEFLVKISGNNIAAALAQY